MCLCVLCYFGSETWTLLKSIPFTYDFLVVHVKFDGNKRSPTRKCCDVLDFTTIYLSLSQRRLGHILKLGDEQKSLMYSELVDGRRKRGQPTLRFNDVCKRDLKSWNVGTDKRDELVNNRYKWRSSVYRSLKKEKSNCLSRRRIQIIMSFIYLLSFVESLCLFSFSTCIFEHNHAYWLRLTAGLLL